MLRRNKRLKRYTGGFSVSKKQIAVNRKMAKTYSEIDEDGLFCSSCGRTDNLTHSHIISRSNKELCSDRDNIAIHCQECNSNWDTPSKRVNFPDYIKNLEYVKRVDPQKFRSMIIRDFEYSRKNACDKNNFDYICKQKLDI